MTENQPILFLKFGTKKNMIDLLENGTIYFNTIDYFQKLEEQGLRGDSYEGTTRISNYHEYDKVKVTMTIPDTGKEVVLNPNKFHVREFLTDIKGNIFSMYCIRPKDLYDIDNFKIDPRVKKFGTHFVLIRNTELFIEKICSELEKKNLNYKSCSVEYYNKTKVNGKINLFQKSNQFDYQKEFRIVTHNKEIKPIIINIGDMRDYANIFEVDTIENMKISIKNKKTAGCKGQKIARVDCQTKGEG